MRTVVSRPSDGDAWSGRVGRVQAHIDGLVTADTIVFLAGMSQMERDVRHALAGQGVAARDIRNNYEAA